MKLKFDQLITACYRGLVSMGEQWLRLLYNVIILVGRMILTDKFVLYLALSHSITSCFLFKYVAETSL